MLDKTYDLPLAMNAIHDGFKGIILPKQNAKEAGVISGLEVYGMENIHQVVSFLYDQYTTYPLGSTWGKNFHQQTNH